MAHIDKHPAGTFCWAEMATTDQSAAKSFYGSLFGWNSNDQSMAPGDVYTMFELESRPAAAAYTLRAEERSQGVPPHWALYVAVDSADATAERSRQLGGKVLAGPFDVFDVGRMAVIQDPTGAIVSVWQPQKHSGAGIIHVHGTLSWADLITREPDRAARFYSGLFNWAITPEQNDPSGYLHIAAGGHSIGGIPQAKERNPQIPPHWLIYFHVTNCDESLAKAKQLGAASMGPAITMEGVGRWAVLTDPQGAMFAIFEPAPHHH